MTAEKPRGDWGGSKAARSRATFAASPLLRPALQNRYATQDTLYTEDLERLRRRQLNLKVFSHQQWLNILLFSQICFSTSATPLPSLWNMEVK